jgi:HlyD family secretion protein
MNPVVAAPAEISLLPRLRTALFEIAAHEPEVAPRWTLRIISALFVILLLWAIFAELDIVAVAEGRLVPQTYVKVVQPAESGIVREILVREGDMVQAGQVLLRLDPTENAADSTAVQREAAMQRLELRRIDAELAGVSMKPSANDDVALLAQMQAQQRAHRQAFLDSLAQERQSRERASRELAAAHETERKLEKTLPSYEHTAVAYEKLASQQQVGQLQAEEQRRIATEQAQDLASQRATVQSLRAAVAQSDQRLAQLKSSYESDLHTARVIATEKLTQLDQQNTKLQYRQSNLELKAPQAGTVKELATTTVGAVVQPGTVLLSLVPANEPLRAEVSVQNQDIGFVKEGQPVRLKLSTYPFQRYGMLEGIVKTVIADASAQSSQNSTSTTNNSNAAGQTMSFKAVIDLNDQALKANGTHYPLAAGMQLAAEIVEGKRTVLQYLLSPVQRVTNEAGRER